MRGTALNLFSQPAFTQLLAAARTLGPGEVSTTIYISDLQFQRLGARAFTHNPLIKKYFPPADRNLVATLTAPLFFDESIRRLIEEHGAPLRAEVKGDIADTSTYDEFIRFEKVLERHQLAIEGFSRGNHSGGNAFGVCNLNSSFWSGLRKSLKKELLDVAGSERNVLTAQKTFRGMHRSLHQHRGVTPGVEAINTEVAEADYEGYRLGKKGGKRSKKKGAKGAKNKHQESVVFNDENRAQIFKKFWKPSPGTKKDSPHESPFWECLVNYQEADKDASERTTQVTPFYIQASEQVRIPLEDGSEVPVYTISLDALDHTHFSPLRPKISPLQLRLVEAFIDKMREENPNARFKLSCHFSAQDLFGKIRPFWREKSIKKAAKRLLGHMTLGPWRRIRLLRGRKLRKALRKFLSREEIILYSYGHTHERDVQDLTKRLRLKRKTSLMEINVPSLIDYHPTQPKGSYGLEDGRAMVIETIKLEKDESGQQKLKVDLEFKGLDTKDIAQGSEITDAVAEELRVYKEEYGYEQSKETLKQLQNQHFIGWMKGHVKRIGRLFTVGIGLKGKEAKSEYWRELSLKEYAIDNFTVASTVNMFNDAYYLLPFLESLSKFIDADGDTEELAVKAQLDGLYQAIIKTRTFRKHEFNRALGNGERPAILRQYNDLFVLTKAYGLAELLLQLKPGGQARTFAVLAGIEASREEYFYHKRKPSRIPNKLPSIVIPLQNKNEAARKAIA